MNFYLIEKAEEKKRPELLSAIKQFLKERLSGAIEDPVLQLAYGGTNPFFLKTQAGILWVRVLEEALTSQDISALLQEFDRVSQMFRQKVRFYIFAPGYASNLSMPGPSSQELLFFEYFFLRSRFGQGVAVRDWHVQSSPQAFPETPQEKALHVAVGSSGRLQNARLEREELSELINLSLELRGLGPAASSAF